MRIFFWMIASTIVAAVLGTVILLQLRFLNKVWWRNKIIKRSAFGLVLFGILSVVIWSSGVLTKLTWLAKIGSTMAVLMLTVSLGLIIALPFSSIFNRLSRPSKKSKDDETINLNRRRFLQGTAAVFPLAASGLAVTGIARAHFSTIIDLIPFEFDNLPSQLDRFRILHLSDSHLGIYKHLDDLQDIVERASDYKPDLVVFSGDISDDLSILPDSLKIVSSLKPKYGAYASLGNHEYYRGIKEVLRAFDKSELPLLRSSGHNIDVGGTNLFIVGADDPRHMGDDYYNFLKKSLSDDLEQAPNDAFYLAMTHRPEGFIPASEFGVKMTLSGHTHGGQIGWGNRSLFSIFSPDSYLRGPYTRNGAQMYVSSGVGHWFPFRLGCPSEAPIIELRAKA